MRVIFEADTLSICYMAVTAILVCPVDTLSPEDTRNEP